MSSSARSRTSARVEEAPQFALVEQEPLPPPRNEADAHARGRRLRAQAEPVVTTSTASRRARRAAAATSRAWRLGSTCGRTRRSHAAKDETRAGPDVQRARGAEARVANFLGATMQKSLSRPR